MALDTRYRPSTYDDVLGQEAAVAVLRQFVKEGKGFHQSYVFCGQHGSGKTTLGRVLARALLCQNPVEGNPCDKCTSCEVLLKGGTHECFEELDAASKSKKEDLERIVEDVTYSTFSGKRRIYLFDESHRLSKQALDILLKPMEDSIEGSEDKKLVCIFCTTDPSKMSVTIFSRCAPAFVIRQVSPEIIADRLALICAKEGIAFDQDALLTISEISESHIRDALKNVEGISMLGKISQETVSQYLQLGANDLALSVVEALGLNLKAAVTSAIQLSQSVSPASAYERIAEVALCSYRAHLEVGKIPSQWNSARVLELSKRGSSLLGVSSRFAAPPHRPTPQTFLLDVGTVHYGLLGEVPASKMSSLTLSVTGNAQHSEAEISQSKIPLGMVPAQKPVQESSPDRVASPAKEGTPVNHEVAAKNSAGIWIDTRGIGNQSSTPVAPELPKDSDILDPQLFRELVRHHLRGLRSVNRRSG